MRSAWGARIEEEGSALIRDDHASSDRPCFVPPYRFGDVDPFVGETSLDVVGSVVESKQAAKRATPPKPSGGEKCRTRESADSAFGPVCFGFRVNRWVGVDVEQIVDRD